MRTLDLYVLRHVLWPLALALAIALLALLLERLVGLLDLFVNKSGPLWLIVQMLTNLIPHYLGLALPAAFFVAVLLGVMRLNQTSEIDAMLVAGVGLWRLAAPIMALAVVLTLCSAITINYLQPYARYAYRALSYALTNTAWHAAVESGAFFNEFAGTTVLVDRLDPEGAAVRGVFAYREDGSGRSTVITAQGGALHASGDDLRLYLQLLNGVRMESGPPEVKPRAVRFDRYDLPLDLASAVGTFHARGGDEEELTLAELWDIRLQPPAGMSSALIQAEISHRVVRTLTILVLPLLAVPLGIASRRERKSLALGLGLVVLVFYHHLLQLGHSFASAGRIPPMAGLWLPFAAFALGGLWTFMAAGRRPDGNPLADILLRVDAVLRGVGWRGGWQRGTG